MRPFRFGVQVMGPADAAGWVEQARRVEALGYSTLTLPDHFTSQLAPLPALAVAAAVTTTLRVGAFVHDNDYKHPLVLAKELATLDVLSSGRVEIGLGAGWYEPDYRAAGLPFDPAGTRVDRLGEGIAVIKAVMGGGGSFTGSHYAVTDHEVWPPPVQRPRPPLLVGGAGRRVLRLAAREADIVGVNGGPTTTREAVVERVATVRAAAAGRDVELNVRPAVVVITTAPATALGELAARHGVPHGQLGESPFVLVGSTAAIADTLRRRREELGFSYVIVDGADVEPFAPVVAELAGT